jgi:hypothetical protein
MDALAIKRYQSKAVRIIIISLLMFRKPTSVKKMLNGIDSL